MNFTGERYIPGEGGCQISYEHLHRYFFALRWAESARVLDLACGNGYGSALMARRADYVWALDIDEEAIMDAGKKWASPNVAFLRGDARQLPLLSGSIDLVVAMEVLEHLDDPAGLIREIARVSCEKGVVLISTPNKAEYSDARNYRNPFHKKELCLEEFVHLLRQYFPFVEITGQRIRAGSLITHNASDCSGEVFEEPVDIREKSTADPMYYLAVCSKSMLSAPVPPYSVFLDSTDGLILEAKEEIARLGEWGKSLEAIVRERDRSIRELHARIDEEVRSRDQSIRALQDELLQKVESRDQTIRGLQDDLAREVDLRDKTIQSIQNELKTELGDRDRRIIDILNLLHLKEKEYDERGVWALSLQAEVENLSRVRRAFFYRILSRIGLLPK
jgi:SAM-dependent methyltransferase